MDRHDVSTMQPGPPPEAIGREEEFSGTLLPPDASGELRSRWESIQAAFIDEPRDVVKQADDLVAHAIRRLSETFGAERARLEQQWSRGDDVSTEDFRLALRRYRAFFHRLLAV